MTTKEYWYLTTESRDKRVYKHETKVYYNQVLGNLVSQLKDPDQKTDALKILEDQYTPKDPKKAATWKKSFSYYLEKGKKLLSSLKP